jgi:GNAT superfamily N-acetyltransferase
MKVSYLADHEDLITDVARLNFKEWGHFRPGDTVDARAERLKACCGKHQVPSVVVGILDSKACGSAMLLASDMESRPELGPWLAGVVVASEHRGKGIATELIQAIVSEAELLGVSQLFLHTQSSQSLYARLGWTEIERCEYKGVQVSIMCRQLP